MKACQQSLHHQRGQSRAPKEAHSQELDDVRVAEGAHQLTFLYKLGRRLEDIVIGNLGTILEDVVDLFSGTAYRYRHFLHAGVGSSADCSSRELNVRQYERPKLRIVTKKIYRHFPKSGLKKGWGSSRLLKYVRMRSGAEAPSLTARYLLDSFSKSSCIDILVEDRENLTPQSSTNWQGLINIQVTTGDSHTSSLTVCLVASVGGGE